MNEIEKLKHFKENKVETDYIKVCDRSLNKKTYKQLIITRIRELEK